MVSWILAIFYTRMVAAYWVKRAFSFLSKVKHSRIIPILWSAPQYSLYNLKLGILRASTSRVLQVVCGGTCAVSMMNLYLWEHFTIVFVTSINLLIYLDNTISRFLTVVFNCWGIFIFFSFWGLKLKTLLLSRSLGLNASLTWRQSLVVWLFWFPLWSHLD